MAVHPATDTIAAIATAPGTGGIGIIRISGPQAPLVLKQLFVPRRPIAAFLSHKLYYGTVIDPAGQVLDEALAVHMHAPHTYTREDIVELHCHGGALVLQTILRTVLEQGIRAAEPGEFTKRAFLAGRIDLTQAEAVIDLIQARTERGAQLAVNQLKGRLLARLEEIRTELTALLALMEVAIDFPDEDVEIFNDVQAGQQLKHSVITPLEQLIALAEQGRIVREGIKVVIAGQPNVGKSSLLNALLREERALVTPVPGTTRDTIEECIALRGIPLQLVDTAGIRLHQDPVEALGIERARQKMEEADLVLFLVDAGLGMDERARELYATIKGKKHLIVLNKMDLVEPEPLRELARTFAGEQVVALSAKHQQGLDRLEEAIYLAVVSNSDRELCEQMSCAPNTRHRAVLHQTLAACRRFEQALAEGAPVDLLAVEVQSALDALGDIIGLTTPDDVLDLIFSRFCIGK